MFWWYMANKKSKLLLSSDTLWWFGLDLIFEIAKTVKYDGIDLAIRKNFDSWNTDYVKKLSDIHNLPVKIIQTSATVNAKELNLALDLCEATGADTITINAPQIIDFKAHSFLADNLDEYKKQNPDINFSIINPPNSNIFALPIPKYYFVNVVDIIKKQWCYLGLDISNMDEEALENDFMRKLDQFIPYLSVIYLSDKTKVWKSHVLPWEWVLKLSKFLKKLKQNKYVNYFSVKLDVEKIDLADSEKVEILLKKAKNYYDEYFTKVEIE